MINKLILEHVSFNYHNQENISKALNDISLIGNEKEIIAILGPNGSGKSTLLKCINKILKIESGSITLNDLDIMKLSDIERSKKIGYVPQEIIFGETTVFDAVLLGRKPYISFHVSHDDLKRTEEVLKELNLDSLALRSVNSLSGGEKQRVAIARTLVQDSDVILLDEPTSNLDIKSQLEIINIIKEMQDKNKIILVTMHDINLALTFATHFAFIKNGQIMAFGDQNIITEQLIQQVYDVYVDIIINNNKKIISVR